MKISDVLKARRRKKAISTDYNDVITARKAFNDLKDYVKKNPKALKPADGGLEVKAGKTGMDDRWSSLTVIFLPTDNNVYKGFLGFKKSRFLRRERPGMAIFVKGGLTYENIISALNDKEKEKTFIHEFIHYMQWIRNMKKDGEDGDPTEDLEKYFNSESEFEAYYKEGLHRSHQIMIGFSNDIKTDVKKIGYDEFVKTETHHFVDYLMINAFDRGFISYLTDANRERLKKMLTNYIKHRLIPGALK